MSSRPPYDFHRIDDLYRQIEQNGNNGKRKGARFFRSDNPTLNYVLFFATCFTTFATAYIWFGSAIGGLWFSGGIMTILFAHEMGHYLMCKKYGVQATLPYFIPFPPIIDAAGVPTVINPFGTMGAVIKMEGRMPSRKVLFDIGAGGPLAGLVFTIPAIYFGAMMSTTVDLATLPEKGVFFFGDSLLFEFLAWLAMGSLPPNHDITLHPLGFAGWVGLFVTALNLFPLGQLDGGHVIYALFGEKSRYIYPVVLSVFILIAIVFYIGWVPLILLLFLFRIEHPPTLDPYTRLDPFRRNLALIIFVIFILSFTPIPFYVDL